MEPTRFSPDNTTPEDKDPLQQMPPPTTPHQTFSPQNHEPEAPSVTTPPVAPLGHVSPETPAPTAVGPSVSPVVVAPVTTQQPSTFEPTQPPAQPTSVNPQPTEPASTYQAPSQQPFTPVYGDSAPVMGSGGHNRRKRKLLIGGVTTFAVVALLAGGVFGLYLPSRPGNVWKAGWDHTGTALETVIDETTKSENVEALKKYQVTGKLSVDSDSFGALSGTLDTKGNDTDTTTDVDVKLEIAGQPEKELGIKLLTQIASGNQYPDIYLQMTGLNSLGLDESSMSMFGLGTYEGKWLYVSGDDIQSLADMGASAESEEAKQVSEEDAVELTNAVSGVLQEYVFTGDTSKAVVENRKFLGKETSEGIKTNRYEAGLNKANVKKLCQALGDAVAPTKAYKKLITNEASQQARIQEFVSSCKKSANSIKQSDTFDVWIGGKYTLIHKLRFFDTEKKSEYVEIGQIYTGGDDIKFFFNSETTEVKGKATFETNFKTAESKGNFNFSGGGSGDKTTAIGDVTIKPFKGDATIVKPTKDVVDIFKDLETLTPQPTSFELDNDDFTEVII